jgi:hypothetical protein
MMKTAPQVFITITGFVIPAQAGIQSLKQDHC